jgi:iron complex outermembrane receptor protein
MKSEATKGRGRNLTSSGRRVQPINERIYRQRSDLMDCAGGCRQRWRPRSAKLPAVAKNNSAVRNDVASSPVYPKLPPQSPPPRDCVRQLSALPDRRTAPHPMQNRRTAGVVACMLPLLFAPIAIAQTPPPASSAARTETATISGRVIDQTTGDPLENARVVLSGTALVTTTERGGQFLLRAVPPGDHVLVVTYTGFDSVSRSIQSTAGRDTPVRIEMTSGPVAMDAFVVNFRRGEAEELMLRRNATNVVDVVSSKTFGEMADGSLSISRLAGMTGGTGIRGIAGEFNLVRVDGGALATPSDSTASGTTRSVDINQIPGDMIERIEVTKSPRPDMDADAVGGTINLITKSALDRKGRRTTYSVGGIASPSYEVQKMGYLGSLEHSDILGTSRRLGYSVTLNHNRRYSNVEQIITDYFTDLIPGLVAGRQMPVSSFRAAQEIKYEDRTGAGLKFDFKPRDTLVTQLSLLYQHRYSHADTADWRLTNRNHVLVFDQAGRFWYAPDRVRAGLANTDGAVPVRDANGNIIAFPSGRGEGGVLNTFTEHVTDFYHVRQLRYNARGQDQIRKTYSANFGGRYTGLPDTRIEFSASYSWGNAKRREWPDGLGTYLFDVTGSNVRIDRTKDFLHPEVTFTGGTLPTNVDAVGTVNNMQQLDARQIEEQFGVALDAERALRTQIPITLKSGVRYRDVVRDIDRGEHQYSYLGRNADLIGTTSINPFGRYPTSFIPDIKRVRESLKAQPNLWREDMLLFAQKQNEHNGHASESIKGAYVMATMRVGKFTLLPGGRGEWTQAKGTATVRNRTAGVSGTPLEWAGKETRWGTYHNLFPHFHLKYEPTDALVIRGAFTTGIGRPPWKNILPEAIIDPVTRSITMSNTNLRPQYTKNFDLGAEYYFKSGGIFGVNVFRKTIDDLIFNVTRPIGPDDGFDTVYDGWMLITTGNVAWAWVKGIEFDYRQQLTFLPGLLKRFGIFANLTLLETKGNYSTPDGSITSDIPGFVPKMINAGISYSGRNLSCRVLMQHQAERLSAWDERTREAWRYTEADTSFDVTSSLRVSKRFSLFMNISNLFEDSPIQYQARPNQPHTVSRTSRRFDFGLRGSL